MTLSSFKKTILGVFLISFSLSFVPQTYAKVLPKKQRAAYSVSARLSRNRRAVLVTFNNTQQISKIAYMLSYKTHGKEEGVGGTISQFKKNSITRELTLGTCSSGVCRYHGKITNIVLDITATFKNGKQITKHFKIKI